MPKSFSIRNFVSKLLSFKIEDSYRNKQVNQHKAAEKASFTKARQKRKSKQKSKY
mgnify:FL=1